MMMGHPLCEVLLIALGAVSPSYFAVSERWSVSFVLSSPSNVPKLTSARDAF